MAETTVKEQQVINVTESRITCNKKCLFFAKLISD